MGRCKKASISVVVFSGEEKEKGTIFLGSAVCPGHASSAPKRFLPLHKEQRRGGGEGGGGGGGGGGRGGGEVDPYGQSFARLRCLLVVAVDEEREEVVQKNPWSQFFFSPSFPLLFAKNKTASKLHESILTFFNKLAALLRYARINSISQF